MTLEEAKKSIGLLARANTQKGKKRHWTPGMIRGIDGKYVLFQPITHKHTERYDPKDLHLWVKGNAILQGLKDKEKC